MLVNNLDELSVYLAKWYGVSDLGLSPEKLPSMPLVPITLLRAWTAIGRLFVGYDEWQRFGTPSPLACQDGFVAPGLLSKRAGFVQVVVENQGNWAIGYKDGDQATDPEMFSDFLEQEISGTGFVPLGCKLSDLIITSALTETIFFGSTPVDETQSLLSKCDRVVWNGYYYNAVGFGDVYETPSHQIRTNNNEDMLALYWNDKFSGFLASSSTSRERLRQLLDDFE